MARRFDRELLVGFVEEVRGYLPKILELLEAWFLDRRELPALEEAHRLMHCIKGAASMVGLGGLSHIAWYAEAALDDLAAGQLPATAEAAEVLAATTAQIERYLAEVLAGPVEEASILETVVRSYRRLRGLPEEADGAEIERLLAAAPERLPAPPVLPVTGELAPAWAPEEGAAAPAIDAENASPELLEAFAQETEDHLQTIGALLRALDSAPEERRLLEQLRRSVHTLKGAASMMGARVLSGLAHRMEDLLEGLGEARLELETDAVALLFATTDALEDIAAGREPTELIDVYRRYDELLGKEAERSSAAPGPEPPDGEAPWDLGELAAAGAAALLIPAVPAAMPRPGARAAAAAALPGGSSQASSVRHGELVRVPIDRLDELVRLVSELVVNRSTFEQHFAGLHRESAELGLSLRRLRRISTRLEAEPVKGGRGRAAPAALRAAGAGRPVGAAPLLDDVEEFDELELDRYSELHLLSRELAETVSDVGAADSELAGTIGDFDSSINRMARLSSEIQDRLMRLRMVPLATLASRLHRAVRVTAAQQGKLADLIIEGQELELDKTVLEEIADPLLHLLRNAVDHGVEPPALRQALGKPARGQIRLQAFYEGTQVVIRVSDDGAGLDLEAIRSAAVARGFLAAEEAARLADEELSQLVFMASFSTASEVSEVSGRGVGLDVVKSSAGHLKGSVTVATVPAAGVTFSIRLPMTLAISRVLIVRAHGERFAMPLSVVTQILRVEREEIEALGGESVLRVGGKVHPLVRLGEALNLRTAADESVRRLPVLILQLGERQVALMVDQLVEAREVVVKTLGSLLRRVHGVTGATLMGDGSVVLILNPYDLVREAPRLQHDGVPGPRAMAAGHARALDVLIVDDSLSVRRVLSNLVRGAGWNPIAAKDGIEALEVIQRRQRLPDVVLLDIEMPRMDGYELTATLRAQPGCEGLPIVMLTSRAGDKHRRKAFDLGATEYLVKPYHDETLLNVMKRVAREAQRPAV